MEDVTLDEASGSKRYIRERGQPDSYPQKQKGRKCLRCSRAQHRPARKATCYRCHWKGHFSKCCSSTVVEDVSSEHSDLNSVFQDTLSLTNETLWAINVMVEGGSTSEV